MRIKGKKISEPNIEVLVIPRGDENIILKARAVLDMDEFDKIIPEPRAPMKITKGGQRIADIDNAIYKGRLEDRNRKRIGYMIIKSLEATEDLEWENISFTDPSTWDSYEKELRESGFSNVEIMRIVQLVMKANCLDEARLEEARQSFLASQELELSESYSHEDGQVSTQSGEHVKESELDPQE